MSHLQDPERAELIPGEKGQLCGLCLEAWAEERAALLRRALDAEARLHLASQALTHPEPRNLRDNPSTES